MRLEGQRTALCQKLTQARETFCTARLPPLSDSSCCDHDGRHAKHAELWTRGTRVADRAGDRSPSGPRVRFAKGLGALAGEAVKRGRQAALIVKTRQMGYLLKGQAWVIF